MIKAPRSNQRPAAATCIGLLGLLIASFVTGCRTTPAPQLQRPANGFPADAIITQRGILTTALGRQYTFNGYLASSSVHGQRLIITENFGAVLADFLVKPDGAVQIIRSSRAFKPDWIEHYMAADVRCIFGNATGVDCPGVMLATNHFLIQRRWYELDLQIVNIKPRPPGTDLFRKNAGQSP